MKTSIGVIFFVCFALLPNAFAAQAKEAIHINGVVRERVDDERTNTSRLGSGIANVLVSNGRDIARTDAKGRYRLSVQSGQTVFVIKPSGFSAPRDAQDRPRFWRHHFPHGSPALRYFGIEKTHARRSGWDFSLRRHMPADGVLDVLIFGDPQPRTAEQAGYFDRDIVMPIAEQGFGQSAADLGLTLGDVVHDDLSLLPLIKKSIGRLNVPWLTAPGNHDIDFDAKDDEDSLLSFRQLFGPDTFAWEEAQSSFIMLDDVIYGGAERSGYIGGLREDQLEFLTRYLASLDVSKRLVIGVHIPFFTPRSETKGETFRARDRERLFELLRPFKQVLLLSAHGHVQEHYFHDEKDGWHGESALHEYNVGAACGGYWGGLKDAAGIPDSTMQDGTPNGFASMKINDDGAYSLRWHVAREPAHSGIELYAPKVLRRGSWPGVGLFANVLMGTQDSVVEYRIDGGAWQPMLRVIAPDPRVIAMNLADDAAAQLKSVDRVPEAAVSEHMWRISLPTSLSVGEHVVDVRTTDRWQGEQSAQVRYRLDDWAE